GVGFESDQNLAHYQILRPIIEAPSETFQPNGTASSSASPSSLRPAQPIIPGAGAIPGSPIGTTELQLPSIQDSTKRPRGN
ncbi:MAG TPA: hypothetical protein VG537_04445, partial [Candidatus Kapabacteria bacterium]|nr:hypothetical protein [Candidatus Kapabacteria bacterium]